MPDPVSDHLDVDTDTATRGSEAARLTLRSAGYCVLCDRIVERLPEGGCPAGHEAAVVSGRIELDGDEPVPCLPRFNLAAFALPPVWGPAHGQWVGAIFLPLWLFTDSIVETALQGGPEAQFGALIAVSFTFAAQAFFAKRGNGVAWRHVAARMTVAEYVRRERVWVALAAPVGAALLAWAAYYRFVVAG